MKATMKDVAQLAGVSLGSVSKVINGIRVKEVTRQKVLEAIEALNYEPDENARALKTNRSNTIALILPSIWHPFFAEFAYHVEENLSRHQYKMLLCNSDGDSAKEGEYIQMVRQSKVDGIIGITYSDIDRYVSSQLPFVTIDRHFSEEATYVTSDNYQGGQMAAQELLRRGCQHLALIGGTSVYPTETNRRKEGFYDYCHSKGVEVAKFDLIEPIANLTTKITGFLAEHPLIDGIFAMNDLTALKTMACLTTLGKEVVTDYQIIGFDGIRKNQEMPYELSTIVQSIDLMAQKAVETLLAMITGGAFEQRIVLPVRFYEGGTTKNH